MEIAIPLVALGGMYVAANSDSGKAGREGYTSMGKPANYLPGVTPPRIPVNYPTTEAVKLDNVNRYPNASQATDKYFDQTVYERVAETNPPGSPGGGGGGQVNMSLTGQPIDSANFKHANMVPYFGGKIRGSTANANTAEGLLDNLQGAGSQFIRKEEVAPLFKPQKDYQFPHGSPNRSDFMMSRENPSMRMANIKPWAEEKIAPGLGKGYNCNGGAGFNSGMEARDSWLPKTVNELRVDTNPKMTFGLDGHQGPAMAKVVDPASAATQGHVDKYRPDTDYKVGPGRWFTTTGLEHAPTGRAIEAMPNTKRPETAVPYYGNPEAEHEAGYVSGVYEPAKKTLLPGPPIGQVDAGGHQGLAAGQMDIDSYQQYGNNRGTTRQATEFGGVAGTVKAIIAPILDVLRPSRKEDFIGSSRVTGNPGAPVANVPIYNPADRTRTTIREMTEGALDGTHANVQSRALSGGYEVADQQPVEVQRDSTNCSMLLGASPGEHGAEPSQSAVKNQRNNPYKGMPDRPNPGGTQIFNQNDNIRVKRKSGNTCDGRVWAPHGRTMPPSIETHGRLQAIPETAGHGQSTIGCERINPELLNAFKSNPYTQSLSSWAAP